MDHLALPMVDNSVPKHADIPYLCNEQFTYDDLGMLTYPERAGVDVHHLLNGGHENGELLASAPFLQSWLWFGLLGEAIGIGSRTDRPQRIASRADFITERPDGQQVLNTARLHEFILVASNRNQAPLFQQIYAPRLLSCLEIAMDTSEHLSERMVEGSSHRYGYDSMRPLELVLLSVQVLAATLVQYTDILVTKNYWPAGRLLPTRLRPGTKLADRLLIQAGWPRCQISKLPSNVLLRYYLLFISKDQHSQDHAECSSEKCVEGHEKGMPVRPAHTFSSCNCRYIKVASGMLENIIKADKIPLLSLSRDTVGEEALEITSATTMEIETLEYFAISHVRMNGLGNNFSNSLPLCQLERIQRLVNGVSKTYRRPALFWIDTLCIPLEAKLKKQALLHAREIFRNASAVLVLELSLSSRIAGDAQECLLRIKYSPWTKRLWTIQEGALARELYFEFRDSLPSLNSLIARYNKLPKEHQLLSCKTGHHHSSERPEELLALLDIDLKHAYRAISEDEYDKERLRMMMRLGYLVFPQMCYFGEHDDLIQGEIVINALKSIYGEMSLPEQAQDTGILDQVSKDNIRRRLNLMEKTDLNQNNDPALEFRAGITSTESTF